jgi:uncharacterized protein DUF6697
VSNRVQNGPQAQGPSTSTTASGPPRGVGHRDNRFCSRDARKRILREAGVDMSSLTVEDHALALRTPDITSQRFTALFGGLPSHERPQSREKNVICVNQDAQPYAPSSPGESGLLFTLSDRVLLEDTRETFHLFLSRDPRQRSSSRAPQLRYLGTYKKVPTIHATVEPEEWLGLSTEVGEIFEHFSPLPPCYRTGF